MLIHPAVRLNEQADLGGTQKTLESASKSNMLLKLDRGIPEKPRMKEVGLATSLTLSAPALIIIITAGKVPIFF